MTSSRSGRPLLLPLVALTLVLGTFLGRVPAIGASRSELTASVNPPRVELVQHPGWVVPDRPAPFTVRLSGEIPDLGSSRVRVRMHQAVRSVARLRTSADVNVGNVVFRSPSIPIAELTPNPDGSFTVPFAVSATPADARTARVNRTGVHPVVISLLDDGGVTLAEVRTPVIVTTGPGVSPRTEVVPTVALLATIAAPTSIAGDPDAATAPAPLGDRALDALSGLAGPLSEHPALPITVVGQPATIEALTATTRLPTDPRAARAADVLGAIADRDFVPGPFLPLPLGALTAADLAASIPTSVDVGRAALAAALTGTPLDQLWDATGPVGEVAADVLVERGVRFLLLDSAGDRDGSEVPSGAGPHPLAGTDLLGLVVESDLTAVTSADRTKHVDGAVTALAEIALAGSDGLTRLVRSTAAVVAPVAGDLYDLLADPASPIATVSVASLLDVDRVDDEADPLEDWDIPAPDDPTVTAESLREIAGAWTSSSGQVSSLRGMHGPDSPAVARAERMLAAAVAVSPAPSTREELVEEAANGLADTFDAVMLAGQTDVNLTSRRGTLPVTVANATGRPIDVVVRVRSDRLEFPDGGELPIRVDSDSLRIDVPVQAKATGSVPVFVEVWTPDLQVRLDSRQLNVRSTAISGVGLAISFGALVVLVVWWIRTWRSKRSGSPATD